MFDKKSLEMIEIRIEIRIESMKLFQQHQMMECFFGEYRRIKKKKKISQHSRFDEQRG